MVTDHTIYTCIAISVHITMTQGNYDRGWDLLSWPLKKKNRQVTKQSAERAARMQYDQ